MSPTTKTAPNITAHLRIYRINGDIVFAPRTMSRQAVAAWYEKEENREADDIELVSLTEKYSSARHSPDWGTVAGRTELTPDDLPMVFDPSDVLNAAATAN